jgi:hypothetical protein
MARKLSGFFSCRIAVFISYDIPHTSHGFQPLTIEFQLFNFLHFETKDQFSVPYYQRNCILTFEISNTVCNITVTISDIMHRPIFYLKTLRFGRLYSICVFRLNLFCWAHYKELFSVSGLRRIVRRQTRYIY